MIRFAVLTLIFFDIVSAFYPGIAPLQSTHMEAFNRKYHLKGNRIIKMGDLKDHPLQQGLCGHAGKNLRKLKII